MTRIGDSVSRAVARHCLSVMPTRAKRIHKPRAIARLIVAVVATFCGLASASRAIAVTPESPEVQAMVDKALKYLETQTDDRLGAKCLIALAYHKRGISDDHPRIKEAVEACRNSVESEKNQIYIYSKGLAVIFLSELNPTAYRDVIAKYATLMELHQMPHGGFGYTGVGESLGDTSQTQYAALADWELLRTGIAPKIDSVERCTNWLLRTQAIDGAWAYKGQDPGSFSRIEQGQKSPCMLSAGLSSVLIFGNMLGLLTSHSTQALAQNQAIVEEKRPAALVRVQDGKPRQLPSLKSTGAVSRDKLLSAASDGKKWFNANFDVTNGGYYTCYSLYAMERYKSFEEYIEGDAPEEPEWYNKGYEWLKGRQQPDGSWSANGDSSAPCSTAFAVLFLLRSTQASIKASLGEGTLVGGRGLPRDLSKVKLRGGRLVVQQKATEIDQLLDLLDDSKTDALDALVDDPAALDVAKVGPDQARRLQQVARSGKAEARLVAVRALAKLRILDYAPTLIYAMTDPDPRVVREANGGLESVSRRFEGFGLSDNFDDAERNQVVDKWKSWYRTVRPDAAPLP